MRLVLKIFAAIASIAMLAASFTACNGGDNGGGESDPRENIVKVERSSSVPFTYHYYIPEGSSNEPVVGLVLVAMAGPYPASTSYADVEETAHSILSSFIGNIIIWSDIEWPTGLIPFTVAIQEGQTLSRDQMNWRPDLEIVDVLNHFKSFLADKGYTVDPQIFVTGFSSGGMFTNRIALLHPTLIKAAAPGGASGLWTMPLASYQGAPLPYHIGVQDLESMGLPSFDVESFTNIPFFVFTGAEDNNDALLECGEGRGCSGLEWHQIVFYTNFFGSAVSERAESFHNQLIALGMNSSFKSYAGVGHWRTEEMDKDVINFFSSFTLNSRPLS